MADEQNIVIAKIQNRRGLRRDLPQPLDSGELGWCIDTGQLYIGADPDDIGGDKSLIIELYTTNSSTQDLANQYIQAQLIEYNFLSTNEVLDPNDPNYLPTDIDVVTAKADALLAEMLSAAGANVTDPDQAIVVTTETIVPYVGTDTNAYNKIEYGYRGYIIYDTSGFGSIPDVDGDTGDFVYTLNNELFESGILNLGLGIMPTPPYTVDDSGAMVNVINTLYGLTGLVILSQNVEVFTEYSPNIGVSSDQVLPGISFTLVESGSWQPVDQLVYKITNTDAVIIEYSVTTTTGTPPAYSRIGSMKIITDGASVTMTDESTDISDGGEDIIFRSRVDAGDIVFDYITHNVADDLTFTTNARRWRSF